MNTPSIDRLILHTADGRRRVIDPADAYYLEAGEGDTLVRLRSSRPLVDVRRFWQVATAFEPHGFLRINREHAVNLRRIREIRRRSSGRDWEVKLEPPVNRVLPVSRSALPELLKALGEKE
jgi:DNA-binding LytR/AlgR family response regulator